MDYKFPDIKKSDEFKDAAKEVADAQSKAKGARKVTDETTLSVAAEILSEVDWVIKHAGDTRLELGRPYREHSDAISAEFNELTSPLTGIRAKLTEDIAAYRAEQQEKVEAERKRQEKLAERRQERENRKAEKQGRDPIEHKPPEIPDAPKTIKLAGGGEIQSKTVWKYEIEDKGMIPRKFLQPDKGAINKAVKGGTREIPGIRIYSDDSTAISA